MKWTVVWLTTALNQLADIWNNSPDRGDVAAASDQIDWLLHRDPLHAGEGRADDVRIFIEPPLAVYFVVSEDDLFVTVFDVWRWSSNP